jgi:hypothetical protein
MLSSVIHQVVRFLKVRYYASMKASYALFGLAPLALAFGVSHRHSGSPQLDQIEGYRRWHKVTRDPVNMPMHVAILCAPAPALTDKDNPHVPKRFLVYVNAVGRSSMLTKSSPNFPTGSVIVKEKYDAADFKGAKSLGQPEILTVMVKGKPGSSPSTGDWSFFVTDGKGETVTSSDTKHCVKCHSQVKAGDWVFREYGSPSK